jgi:hypothetical protein
MMKCRVFIAVSFILFFLLNAARAGERGYQTPPDPEDMSFTSDRAGRLVLQRVHGPIEVDGLSDEPGWESIQPLRCVQHAPHFGNEPSEKTEILVAFDDDHLYIAGRLYDKEPTKVQGKTKKRDTMSPTSDFFGILIDTFNDKENALAFFTTPAGIRWDASISNDAVAEQDQLPMNISWNAFWDVATVCNDEGWFAEIRIPLSSLRFQDEEGNVVMGIISWRSIARKNETIIFPAISPEAGSWSVMKPSLAQEVVLNRVQSSNPLYITPYILGGHGRVNDLNEEETAYERRDNLLTELGLDIKYGLTSNLTLDITANTDFAQVEADDAQVNLTRFSLFFPEKRLFFQERASIFEFRFGGSNRLFYSRRIGIYEDEDEVVRIYGGLRLVGRVGGWDLGFMNMQTAEIDDLPSENFGVLRIRRRLFNPYSYLGGMITTRIGMDGSYNIAYGLDGIIRLFGDDYLTINWAQTFEDDSANKALSLDPAKFRLNWERRTLKGIGYNLSLSHAGRNYNPGVGFEMREDYTRFGNRVFYGWIPSEGSLLRLHQVFLDGFVLFRNEDNTIESAEFGPGWTFELKSGYGGTIQPKLYVENLSEVFELTDDIEVPVGDYTFCGVKGQFNTPWGRPVSLFTFFEAGSFYDGRRVTAAVQPLWSLSSTWELSCLYQFNHVKFPDRSQKFLAHLVRLRLLATFTTKMSASAFIQYNGASDIIVANLRIRYNPREGNDLYLVYNHGVNTDRYREMPSRPSTDNRAIMIKYSYTFNVK